MMTMGAGCTLDEAAAEALGEMHRLLQRREGLLPQETAMLISLIGACTSPSWSTPGGA